MNPRFLDRPVLSLSFLLACALPAPLAAGPGKSPADSPEPTRWIRQLGDDDFHRREAASRALERIGEAAVPALRRAAIASNDLEVRHRAARVIDAIQRRLAREALVLRGHTVNISSVVFSPDGRHLLSGGRDGTVRTWDAATGRQERTFRAGGVVTGAVFSADGTRVLAANHEALFLWEASTGKQLRRINRPESASWYFHRAALAPDGRRALTGQQDGSLRLWDLETGRETYCVRAHAGCTMAATFTADGRQALTCGWDQAAALWDVQTGKRRRRYTGGHTHTILLAVAISPDGKRALTASANAQVTCGELCLWDVASGGQLRAWQGHTGQINAVAFSPDGRRALTASHDTTVRLWDLSTGQEAACFRGHTRPVQAVAWSPDGRWAASASEDCTIRLWKVLAE